MKSRKPLVVPALAGIIPCRLKAVQQTAHVDLLHALGCTSDSAPFTLKLKWDAFKLCVDASSVSANALRMSSNGYFLSLK